MSDALTSEFSLKTSTEIIEICPELTKANQMSVVISLTKKSRAFFMFLIKKQIVTTDCDTQSNNLFYHWSVVFPDKK